MTKQELDFQWGERPPYPITITDSTGMPLGIKWPDGVYTPGEPSRVGHFTKEGHLIVWDGAMENNTDRTKGRLLAIEGPPYYDSLRIFERWATEGDEDDKDDKENH